MGARSGGAFSVGLRGGKGWMKSKRWLTTHGFNADAKQVRLQDIIGQVSEPHKSAYKPDKWIVNFTTYAKNNDWGYRITQSKGLSAKEAKEVYAKAVKNGFVPQNSKSTYVHYVIPRYAGQK